MIDLDSLHSPIPPMARVKQHLPPEHIADVRKDTHDRLMSAGLRDRIKSGARVAITAGSRDIGGAIELTAGVCDAVREAGGEPFIIPAMGSHGGATAQGQAEILRLIGVSDSSVGAPVRATMDTTELGKSESGAVAHLDRYAAEADGIIVLARVKTHPESAGELASGLLKMTTIGLGKQKGAQEAHSHGLWESVRAVPKRVLPQSKILFGVAVVENGYRQPLEIEVVAPNYDAFLEADIRLLRLAKAHLGQIPFQSLDVLIVDELGKTISGAGMDPNVIGRWRTTEKGPHVPDYRRIVVRSLTKASLGNCLGIGLADFTTQRFVDSINPVTTYINMLTATEPGGNTGEGKVPATLPSDREAISLALYSALAGPKPRVCRIKNTGELGEFWVSEGLLDEVNSHPTLTVEIPLEPMRFDAAGYLI